MSDKKNRITRETFVVPQDAHAVIVTHLAMTKCVEILTRYFIQIGSYYVTVNGIRFKYRIMDNGIYILGRKIKKPCVLLLMNDGDNYYFEIHDPKKFPAPSAFIHCATRWSDCYMDYGTVGRNYVRAATMLAKQKGVKTLLFTDCLRVYLKDDKQFFMSDLCFLSSGRTWYECCLDTEFTPIQDITAINRYRKQVLSNSWNYVVSRLDQKIIKDIQEEWTDGIDFDDPGSAMLVFTRIKNTDTTFFAMYNIHLISASGTPYSLRYSEWSMDLTMWNP